MKIAVVTGASSGIGREFARQLSERWTFDEMWLIARREQRLQDLAKELPVKTRILPWDLTHPDSIQRYSALLNETQAEVTVVVNASGFGRFAHSAEVPLDVSLNMVDLNVKAVVSLCQMTVPFMTSGSAIINMGSVSSFQPVPYVNVYAATKAFVLSYSRSLGAELAPRGIRVMAVCPMWVDTEFFDHAVVDKAAVVYYNKLWRPEDVVRRALRDLDKGKDVSVLGLRVRAQVLATKLLPHKLVIRVWLKQQKHL